MPRPIKKGLNYFTHDCDMSEDPRMQYLEACYGLDGYAIYNKLLEKIYSQGYYISWSERDALLLAKKVDRTPALVMEVIKKCLEEGLFSRELYKSFEILTSESIQKRFIESTLRRTEIKLCRAILLIKPRKPKWSSVKFRYIKGFEREINVNINPVNVNIHNFNDNINPQRKGKERKGKESSNVNSRKKRESLFPEEIEQLKNQFLSNLTREQPELVKRLRPGFEKKWMKSFYDLLNLDKRPLDQVRAIVDHVFNASVSWWAQTGNIQSPAKFRKRNADGVYYYDVILKEMNGAKKKAAPVGGTRQGFAGV